MLRTVNIVERNTRVWPTGAITVPAGVSTVVLNQSYTRPSPLAQEEIVSIDIFNDGPGTAYFMIGGDCDNITNFNGDLAANGSASIGCRQQVSVFSVAGCKIALTILVRQGAVTNNT